MKEPLAPRRGHVVADDTLKLAFTLLLGHHHHPLTHPPPSSVHVKGVKGRRDEAAEGEWTARTSSFRKEFLLSVTAVVVVGEQVQREGAKGGGAAGDRTVQVAAEVHRVEVRVVLEDVAQRG